MHVKLQARNMKVRLHIGNVLQMEEQNVNRIFTNHGKTNWLRKYKLMCPPQQLSASQKDSLECSL
jgi:hypothetical protein